MFRIIITPCQTIADERIRAACAFLFLSGMRISAFLTMPIKAFDLETRTVKQWPSLGVHTKLSKKATTKLINIPELFEIVRKWHDKVRVALPPDGLWYAPLSPITGEIDPYAEVGEYRNAGFHKDLVTFLSKASIEYKSAHKFRHGHIRYLRDRATNVPHLEAIAKNAMQETSTMMGYAEIGSSKSHEVIDFLCGESSVQVCCDHNGKPDEATIARVLWYLANNHRTLL